MEIGLLAHNAPESLRSAARDLGLMLWDTLPEAESCALCWTDHRVELVLPNSRVHVDFVGGVAAHRRKFGGGHQQKIARAVGVKCQAPPSVLDTTAGQGYDAFVLAGLGCSVTLLERSPVAFLLLQDGLTRAATHEDTRDIVARMTLIHANAHDWLDDQQQNCIKPDSCPDIVYLDPMFEQANQRAKSKKAMASFQYVLDGDLDADALLTPARQLARKRVVVKRSRYAPWLDKVRPDFVYWGQRTRFDVYLPQY